MPIDLIKQRLSEYNTYKEEIALDIERDIQEDLERGEHIDDAAGLYEIQLTELYKIEAVIEELEYLEKNLEDTKVCECKEKKDE